VTWGSRFYSKQTENCQDLNDFGFDGLCPADGVGSIGGTTYTDLSAYWKTPWKGTLYAGINNAFAKNPPFIYSTFANSFDPQYEIPGRFFWVRYSQTF
jgi:iron complex outermembrane receptor protein